MKDEAERAAQVGDTLASTTSMSVVQTTSAPANVNVPKVTKLNKLTTGDLKGVFSMVEGSTGSGSLRSQ